MAEKLSDLAARMQAAQDKGGKTMWHLVLADTVLELFTERGAITADDLRQRLRERLAATEDKTLKQACEAALDHVAVRLGSY